MNTDQPENDLQTDKQSEKNETLTDLQPADARLEETKGGAPARYLRDLLTD